jgi:hypothetical protein
MDKLLIMCIRLALKKQQMRRRLSCLPACAKDPPNKHRIAVQFEGHTHETCTRQLPSRVSFRLLRVSTLRYSNI